MVTEKEITQAKLQMIREAAARARTQDESTPQKVIYELPGSELIPSDVIDGMEAMLGHDTLDTDWDIDDGVPPPGFWRGTHDRLH